MEWTMRRSHPYQSFGPRDMGQHSRSAKSERASNSKLFRASVDIGRVAGPAGALASGWPADQSARP